MAIGISTIIIATICCIILLLDKQNTKTVNGRFVFKQCGVTTALSSLDIVITVLFYIWKTFEHSLLMSDLFWLVPAFITGILGIIRAVNMRVEVFYDSIKYRTIFRKVRVIDLNEVTHSPILGYRYTLFRSKGFLLLRNSQERGVATMIRNTIKNN